MASPYGAAPWPVNTAGAASQYGGAYAGYGYPAAPGYASYGFGEPQYAAYYQQAYGATQQPGGAPALAAEPNASGKSSPPPPPPPGAPSQDNRPAEGAPGTAGTTSEDSSQTGAAAAPPASDAPVAAQPAYDPAAAAAYQQYYAGYTGYNAPGYAAGGYNPAYAYSQQQSLYPGQQGYSAYPYPPATPGTHHPVSTQQQAMGNSMYAHQQQQNTTASYASVARQGSNSSAQTFNAVPPPSSLAGAGKNKQPSSIRPQTNPKLQQQAGQANPAFLRVGSSTTAATAGTAYKGKDSSAASGAGPGAAKSSGGKFPPTFTAWVERCFERCRSDVERSAMTKALTQCITTVEKAGRMWLVDWDKEPIPSLDTSKPAAVAGGAAQTGYDATAGLRSKRSRWEETANERVASPYQQGKKQRKQKAQANDDRPVAFSAAERRKLQQRAGRFGDGRAHGGAHGRNDYDYDDDVDMDASDTEYDAADVVIQGTSTDLEKSYFRLTGPPDPSAVRPPHVLQKALDRLVGLLHKGAVNWFYACDQFKGMRQDCTVQHLRNQLAVSVYEAHGRSALEYGDLAEFNQCQTQLASMYADGIPGCVAEFTAYKVLYHTVHARSSAKAALLNILRVALTFQTQRPDQDAQSAIANALQARTAYFADNHTAFFQAYAAAPALGRALLDVLVPHVRWTALNMLVKSYKAAVPVSFVAKALGFIAQPSAASTAPAGQPLPGCRRAVYLGKAAAETNESAGVAACASWLQAHGAVLEAADSSDPLLDAKASMGKLFIPEEPKVAHGDENLSLGDFLARASGLQL